MLPTTRPLSGHLHKYPVSHTGCPILDMRSCVSDLISTRDMIKLFDIGGYKFHLTSWIL